MASTVWKGYLAFGLISVPVHLFVAARTERISFNQIHDKCGSRIKQQTYCPVCERTVERSELKKGFEVSKGRFALIEEDELKKISTDSSETMEILEFVRVADIDPIYYDSSYFMVPEEAGKKAYELLFQTMQKSGFSAVAKLAMHQREHTVIIRPHSHGLTLHTMFYPEEVREVPEFGKDTNIEVKPQEVALAEKLVEGLAADFDPSKYHDQYQVKLTQLLEAKKAGLEVKGSVPRKMAPVIDLMQALQQSLGQVPQRKPAASVTSIEAGSSAKEPAKKPRGRAASR
jgi:DNA end-binding protein Ku